MLLAFLLRRSSLLTTGPNSQVIEFLRTILHPSDGQGEVIIGLSLNGSLGVLFTACQGTVTVVVEVFAITTKLYSSQSGLKDTRAEHKLNGKQITTPNQPLLFAFHAKAQRWVRVFKKCVQCFPTRGHGVPSRHVPLKKFTTLYDTSE